MARSSRTSIWQERARNPSTRAYLGKTFKNKEIEKTIDLHYVLKEKWAPEQNRQILQDYNLRIGSFARMPLRRAQDRMREVLAHKAREGIKKGHNADLRHIERSDSGAAFIRVLIII